MANRSLAVSRTEEVPYNDERSERSYECGPPYARHTLHGNILNSNRSAA